MVQMDELIGRAVKVHSLASRADLNARDGKIVSYDPSKQRYGVLVDGEAKAMALKPSCLLYGPVFEDDPGMVMLYNVEHLVGHALRGQVKCVERILDRGVDVNACCPEYFMGGCAAIAGHPALDVACEFWMLPHNDHGTMHGGSALHGGRDVVGDVVTMEAVVRLLLTRGAHADTRFPSRSGMAKQQVVNGTSLVRAARHGNTTLVTLLLAHGARVPDLIVQDGLHPSEEPAGSKLARDIASGKVCAEIQQMLRGHVASA